MSDNNGQVLAFSPTARQKLGRRLFPAAYSEPLEPSSGFEPSDQIFLRVDTYLSWPDRLRLLVSGKVRVDARVVTQQAVGQHAAVSSFNILPPNCLS